MNLSRVLLRGAFLFAITSGISISQLPHVKGQERKSNRSPDEATLRQWLKRFPKSDANGDGVLTAEEAAAFRQTLKTNRAGVSPGRTKRVRRGPEPTQTDLRYGPHQRNVFDLWIPKKQSDEPTPIVVFFHGGGFVAGDKAGFDPTAYLDAGFAAVSANYRLVDGSAVLSPIPMRDSARVIQHLRQHASRWNLDPDRIAVSGSSAGAVIAMWIGYHDDLSDPQSDDPVARQSTRVTCVAPINGPTNLDAKWITGHMGGPPHVHGSFPKLFGAPVDQADQPEIRERMLGASAHHLLTEDDPPTLLVYNQSLNLGDIPLPESASTGLLIHHPYFGHVLKSKLDALGVANEFHAGHDPRKSRLIAEWVGKQFAARPEQPARPIRSK